MLSAAGRPGGPSAPVDTPSPDTPSPDTPSPDATSGVTGTALDTLAGRLATEMAYQRLGRPVGIHRVTDTLILPPTVTAWDQVCWVRPPQPHALWLCREIDVIAALRTALSSPPPTPDATDAE